MVRGAGRSFSRGVLRPIQYLLDGALFALGTLLLVRFGLEFYHPVEMNSLEWVIWLRFLSDPLLSAVQSGMSHIIPVSANGAIAMPLGLSVAAWIIRHFVLTYIRNARSRLEEPSPEVLFGPKKKDGRQFGVDRADSGQSREQLLKRYRDIENAHQGPRPDRPPVRTAAAATPPASAALRSLARTAPAQLPAQLAASDGVQRIGRYEILGELGRGAMGAVYKALDPQIGRTVALKVILTRDLPPGDLVIYRERFYREARAAGKMAHPGIVTVHDIAEDAYGNPGLVMEYVEGQTLDRMMGHEEGERLPVPECLDIAIQVADALDYAHRQGVVHRDIKPANILITAAGRAKIADFGVAKLMGTHYTQAGQVVGTPAFMSPEQLTGHVVDARSDLFSFGVVLYWMLTGEKPFSGDTITAISYKVVHTSPLPARQLNPALPAELDTVLVKCLAKNADERYQSAGELAADLQALKAGRPLVAAQPPA